MDSRWTGTNSSLILKSLKNGTGGSLKIQITVWPLLSLLAGLGSWMVLLSWVSGPEDSARTRSGIGPHLMVNLDLQKKPLLLDIGIEAELRRSSLQLTLELNFKNNLSLEVEWDFGTSLLQKSKVEHFWTLQIISFRMQFSGQGVTW